MRSKITSQWLCNNPDRCHHLRVPKVVDTDERRAQLMAATSEAIARDGLANVTLRSIAGAGGWTTGIVTHYFADKRSLVMATFQYRADRARRQIEESVARGESLLDATISTLPLDAESLLDWRVSVSYIGASIGDEEMAQLHRRRLDTFIATVRTALKDEQRAGRLPAGLDTRVEADRLVVVMNGIAIQAVLHTDHYTPARQRAIVEAHLRSLGADRPTSRRPVARTPRSPRR
jgi:AcrR family transcriptional regulator